MGKYKRIINGECSFSMTELFDDVEKAANNSNNGELVECKIDNLRIDFTKVKKEQEGKDQNATAKTDGQAEKKIWTVCPNSSKG